MIWKYAVDVPPGINFFVAPLNFFSGGGATVSMKAHAAHVAVQSRLLICFTDSITSQAQFLLHVNLSPISGRGSRIGLSLCLSLFLSSIIKT